MLRSILTAALLLLSSLSLLSAAPAVPATPPSEPAQAARGAFATRQYRNLFHEAGHSDADIRKKIDAAFEQLFHGDADTQTVFYWAGSNADGRLAYLSDINNRDVRSEGMSYGMMIAVQLDKKAEFDALWNWSRTFMFHDDPAHPAYGYFSWSMNTDGTPKSESPAPDGEEYYAMALYFASARWGDGTGPYDYRAMADRLLSDMKNRGVITGPWASRKDRTETDGAQFNLEHKMVRFTPDNRRPDHTDPSYHLPAYYELWARWGPAADRPFWAEAARVSRDFFQATTNRDTGLAPEYANFDGTPVVNAFNKSSATFGPDAWRTAANWAVDWSWWAADPRERQLSDRIQAFFESKGLATYGNRWALDGLAELGKDHSTALVATNAITSLAATDTRRAARFVEELWNAEIPSGRYRYYDGLWYLMGLLHCSGEFRIWTPKWADDAPAGRRTSAYIDPYAARPRVVVLTDIANEPDDQMSMVRFLLYSNQFDVEGLVATTSTWMKSKPRPDVILSVLAAYEKVQPNLLQHAKGFPTAASLRAIVASGQPEYGMAAVGERKATAGSDLLLRAASKADARPLWVVAWGGTNTLAQSLADARRTRPAAEVEALVSRLRVYAVSDQDDAGPWMRREFPGLRWTGMPSTQNGEEYYLATWTGISGDTFYRNGDGADFSTFTDEWVNANVRSKGPLGAMYPHPCCIHEGDTPTFLGLIDNGMASSMSPAFGGWGGRYVWRQPYGETRAFWTQGGDSFPGNDSSRDTVTGVDRQEHTSDQATIWRWRTAFQHDFAARLDWSIKPVGAANHNPVVVVNGQGGTSPIEIEATVGQPVVIDATGTKDPDGHALRYEWVFYPEAGMGIPDLPVRDRRRPPADTTPAQGDVPAPAPAGTPPVQAGIPSSPPGGPPRPAPLVTILQPGAPRATVVPNAAGVAHVILLVEDRGTPSLTSYRRVILYVK